MLGEFFVAAVRMAVEEAVVSRCPASRRALELILSLRGLVVGQLPGGELRWDGATVTNVTADCLHETANERGKENLGREPSFWAEQSLNSD